jgi:serine phosphatase RsbU (regulator of sigma subunit)
MRGNEAPLIIEPRTTLLGVLSPEEFDAEPSTIQLEPGDSLVVCTDGAIERFNAEGTMAGFDAYCSHVGACEHRADPNAPADILRTLDSLQHGPPDDDTVLLIVSTVVQ